MTRRRPLRHRRRGNILLLTAALMVVMMACIAFSVDVGYLYIARSELQRTADASAIAAAWELLDENAPAGAATASTLSYEARVKANQFAALNPVTNDTAALGVEDVQIGFMANPSDPGQDISFASVQMPNAVRVKVQKTSLQNGEVPLFFARVMGFDSAAAEAEATAALINNFGGFRSPSDGSNLDLLPFALDVDTWNALLAGGGSDNYQYNSDTKTVTGGSDGVREVNLYPQGTGSPGNRGTVDIGGANNSTADIARQIVSGVSKDDMDQIGGSLEFDCNGELELNGDTGISAGVKDELASIIGEPRIIPIFSQVEGPGNNAQYTIVKFVGVRVCYVKLTGSMSSKKVIIQPCNVIARGGIPSDDPGSSYFLYSPVWLVR